MGRSRNLSRLLVDTNGDVEQSALDNVTPSMGKNRVINGDMRIDQRNAGASVAWSTANALPVDRWKCYSQSGSGHTAQRSTDAPTAYGFDYSVKLTVGTGANPSAAHLNIFYQPIEGLNVSDLMFGTASAKTVTISFLCKSSLTGDFGVSIQNVDVSRGYPGQITINSANTWEYKTVTIPGDQIGTWLKDNGVGMFLSIDLGSGTTYEGTLNTWGAGNHKRTSSQVRLIQTSGATFYITGVQLEVGSTATPFERRPYGTELALSQRYYCKSYEIGTVPGTDTQTGLVSMRNWDTSSRSDIDIPIIFPVNMRAVPTFTAYSKGGTSGSISQGLDGSFSNRGFAGTYNASSKGIYAIALSPGIDSLQFASLHYTASAEL